MSEWISVDDGLPDIARPVWLALEGGSIIIGGRGLDGNAWVWCNAYDTHYLDTLGNWCCAALEFYDEYIPTHWQPLPELPK